MSEPMDRSFTELIKLDEGGNGSASLVFNSQGEYNTVKFMKCSYGDMEQELHFGKMLHHKNLARSYDGG